MKIDLSKHKQTVCLADLDKFKDWKEGKCFAKKTDDFDEYSNIIENTISKQTSLEFNYDKDIVEPHNIEIIKNMFDDEYAHKEIIMYNRDEYSPQSKYNDGMYITYKEFVKAIHYYGTDAYYHELKDLNKVLIIYLIK